MAKKGKNKKKLSQKTKGCNHVSNMLDPKEDIFYMIMDTKELCIAFFFNCGNEGH